ncbi:DUF2304 domain-containing protein [Microbacterium sp. ZOR0019]|uniref:DUF2304 domain-containing protein n=1 Tax=Microbacterium sp. ZOR0019 TaxID=1339233 RepID=UPI0009E046BC|nr:DUF2304 domain-containing protein [Microbacterium sp. ZOR0019]
MNGVTYTFGIVAALVALFAIVELMRKGTLRERHAVWWFFGGLFALVIAVFPQTLTWAAKLLGVAVPSNLVFFVAIGLLFLVSLQYGAELTRIEARMRNLSEHAAFVDHRLRVLERSNPRIDAVRGDADAESHGSSSAARPDGDDPEDVER